MLPRFLAAMRLSSSRHRAHNVNTKTLPGPWDKPGSIPRANISSEELVYVSRLPNIGQHVPEYSSPSSSLESSLRILLVNQKRDCCY